MVKIMENPIKMDDLGVPHPYLIIPQVIRWIFRPIHATSWRNVPPGEVFIQSIIFNPNFHSKHFGLLCILLLHLQTITNIYHIIYIYKLVIVYTYIPHLRSEGEPSWKQNGYNYNNIFFSPKKILGQLDTN